MAKNQKLPYTNREFDTILSELRARLNVELPESNDWLESNVGRWITETYAAIADMTAFTIDRQAAECYLDTVETRENLVALLKLLGFQPFNPVSEETEVTFTVTSKQGSDVEIPKGTRLYSSKRSLPWVTTSTTVIFAGETTATAQARQGEYRTIEFVSSGNPFQQFIINSEKVAEGEVAVTVDGIDWTVADGLLGRPNTLVGLGADAEFFRVIHTQDRKTMIEFGDNIDGLIPPKGAEIMIRVFITEHVNGNVQSGEIDQLLDTLPVVSASVTVTNRKASGGGMDHESIASARLRWPRVFASQNRAVTLSDYEAQARLVPSVLQARAVDNTMDANVPLFEIELYIVGANGLTSESLNDEVGVLLDRVKMNPVVISVRSPEKVYVDILITQLYVYRQYVKADVAADVLVAVRDFFTLTADASGDVNMGSSVAISRLSAAIQNVTGVSSFTWVIKTLSPTDSAQDTLAEGHVIVNNTPTALLLPTEWQSNPVDAAAISVLPTEYAVLNSVSFLQVLDDPNEPNGSTHPNLITV